ncbi:hypothetical protein [Streptomyces sp. NBC_00078]|uniref:hypothetical protein n=1 Tax=unclassified Streptomyces TaxID=2593676 RepID=UPI002253489A|nr:hypothetical protein [Streptomyces sp. NBC_00078]MCX5423807.1 hypothetical protein [Streptomyces sp. NBC_00078]
MMDVDPRSTASRPLRASVGLTRLAAVLLVCGAAVQVTGNLVGSSANGGGSGSHPAPTVQPSHPRSRATEAPSPDHPPPTSPAHLPRPTATATGSSSNGR